MASSTSDLDLPALRRKAEAAKANGGMWPDYRPPPSSAVLAMCDEIDRLRAELAEARTEFERIVQHNEIARGGEMYVNDTDLAENLAAIARAFLSRKSPPPDRVGMIVAWLRVQAAVGETMFPDGTVTPWPDMARQFADAIEAGDLFKGGSDG